MSVSEIWLLVLLAVALVAIGLLALALRRAGRRARLAYAERAEALAQRAQLAGAIEQDGHYLAALGQATTDAMLLLDGSRRVVWANAATQQMFDSASDVEGQTFIGLARDSELNQAVVDAAAGRRSIIRQTALGGRTLRISVTPVEQLSGVAAFIEDVTELQRLGRARRDFIANISHELRTPLANIDLAAQTLRQALTTEPASITQRMLDQIHVQVQTLSQLSQEMMELAQIESGQVLLKLIPTEIEPVIRRSVTSLMPQASLKGQHFSIAVPRGLSALIDEQQVTRVISNLVHNAVKFTPEGGAISIEAQPAGAEDVSICVSDSGPGIPKEEQARVFERFYKADRARTLGGTGLGLAIARHIVEGHGGRIWVESNLGAGVTFCFTVPKA